MVRARRGRRGILTPARAEWNPYLSLLYDALSRRGFAPVVRDRLQLAVLVRERERCRFLHLHWPEGLYRFERGPRPLRRPLSRVKLGLLALRLAAARLLAYRLVWTVHQVYPHEEVEPRLDRAAARLLARCADALVVYDAATRAAVGRDLGSRAAAKVEQMPHGSYLGVYANRRARATVRREL